MTRAYLNDIQLSGSTVSSLAWEDITDKPTFASVATSGSYADLENLPTFKTINSESIIGEGNIVISGGSASFEALTEEEVAVLFDDTV